MLHSVLVDFTNRISLSCCICIKWTYPVLPHRCPEFTDIAVMWLLWDSGLSILISLYSPMYIVYTCLEFLIYCCTFLLVRRSTHQRLPLTAFQLFMPYLTTFQLSGTSSGKTSQDGPHPYFLYSKICCPICWSLCNCCFCVLSPNHHNAHKDGRSLTPLPFSFYTNLWRSTEACPRSSGS